MTVRAGRAPDQWGRATSKFSNLRVLMDHGLRVPPTLEVTGADSDGLAASVAALSTNPSDIWMLRFDGDPAVRFTVDGGSALVDELLELVRSAWFARPSEDLRILVQRRLDRRVDGIAVRTAADVIVVESQFDRVGSNFYRDGSVPWRLVFDALRPETAAADGLPRLVVVELTRALRLLPPAFCVEWVLTVDDEVQFVDAKPLPAEFLCDLRPEDGQNECTPVISGSAIGQIISAAGGVEEPVIHLADRTHVDTLGQVGTLSHGVVFRSGGLLSHAMVYCAQLAVPLLMCPHIPVESFSEQAKYKLTVAPEFHQLVQC